MKRSLILSSLVFLLAVTGCSTENVTTDTQAGAVKQEQTKETPQVTKPQQNAEQAEPEAAKPADNQEQKQTVKVYYGDDQALNLIEKDKEIKWQDPQNKYLAAFAKLTNSDDKAAIAMWQGVTAKSSKLENGLLTLDLDKFDLNYGSDAERLMILSLLKTMFQFEEVQKVQLTVNGKVQETLEGHIDSQHPFTRESITDLQ